MARLAAPLALLAFLLTCAPALASAPAAPPGGTQTTSSPGQVIQADIPDGTGSATSTINVSGKGPVLNDVDVNTIIPHTFPNDLVITLTSPAGTTVTLTSNNGGGADNVYGTNSGMGVTWDDQAGTSILDQTFTNGTALSDTKPEEPLGAFVGEDPNGTWTLEVEDQEPDDTGRIAYWVLQLTTLDKAPAFVTTSGSATGAALGVKDNAVDFTIPVSGGSSVWDVAANISFRNPTGTDSRFKAVLESPSGTQVTIVDEDGTRDLGSDPFQGRTFRDDATTFGATGGPVSDASFPCSGCVFSPRNPLSKFMGENPNGNWKLHVTKHELGANLLSASLDVTTASVRRPPAVPSACQAGLQTKTVTDSTGGTVPTTDGGTLDLTKNVSGLGSYLWDIDVNVSLDDADPSDKFISLIAPSGKAVHLVTPQVYYNHAQMFSSVTFDDGAGSANPPGALLQSAPVSGVAEGLVAPEEPLSKLQGEDPNGDWKLEVVNSSNPGHASIVKNWSIDVTSISQTPLVQKSVVSSSGQINLGGGGFSDFNLAVGDAPSGSVVTDVDFKTGDLNYNANSVFLYLVSPSGTEVSMVGDSLGTSNPAFKDTVWDDSSGNPISFAGLSSPEPTLSPEEPFGAFRGESGNGTWVFKVQKFGASEITPYDWTLTVRNATCSDSTAPTNPTLSSATATGSPHKNLATVTADYTAGSDDSSGVDGFSYAWDQSPTTTPDQLKDAEEGAGSSVSPNLSPDGDWYFHLRTRDNDGNWSSAVHLGPFKIDRTAPNLTLNATPATFGTATPQFTFSSTDVSPVTYSCQVDTGTVQTCTSPHTIGAVSAGAHQFKLFATDQAGNVSSTITRNFSVDTSVPDTTIGGGPTGLTSDDTPTFTLSSTIGGSTFECKVDAGSFSTCTSPYTPTLSNGAHTISVRAIAPNSNADPTPDTRSVTVDTVAPDTTISPGAPTVTNDSTPSFSFTSDLGSTFQCKVDSGSFASCTSPHTISPALSDGSHTLTVLATDAAGNVEAVPATHTFTVDTDPPDAQITSGPDALTNDSTPTFQFQSTSGTSFECKVDSGSYASCTSPHTVSPALADGDHTFFLRVTDAAGNVDPAPSVWDFTVDATPPNTAISSGPADGATTAQRPTYGFTSEAGATFECRVDSAAFSACTSTHQVPAQSAGGHTFEVRAVDAAGNRDGTPSTRTFNVDNTEPVTTIDSGPTGPTSDQRPLFGFSSSENGSSFECAIDSGPLAACTTPFQPPSNLSDGAHTFKVVATDPVGNVDTTPATRSFTVDSDRPETSITSGPTGATNATTPTFEFDSDESPSTFKCQIDSGTPVTCNTPYTTPTLAEGNHTISVIATDAAGNADASAATRSFTVDTTAPDTNITSGPADGATTGARPTYGFSSEAGATFECSVDGAAFAGCTSTHRVAAQPNGNHTFAVRATDAAGNTETSPASRDFHVDTTPPETTLTSGPTAEQFVNTATPTFGFDSDHPNSTYECAIDSDPFQPCTSQYTTQPLAQGRRTFYVRATDANDNTDPSNAQVSFTVDTIAPTVAITGGTAGTATTSNASVSFTSNETGGTFQCAIDAGAYQACASPFDITGLSNGIHSVFVKAIDKAGNASVPGARTFTTAVPAPPADTSGGGSGSDGSGSGGGTTTTTGGGVIVAPGSSDDSPPDLRFSQNALTVDESTGEAQILITCPSAEKSCSGTVSLTITGKRGGKKYTIKLKSSSFKLDGGKSKAITLKMSQKQLRRFARLTGRRGKLSVSVRDGSGNRAKKTQTFKL